MNLVFNNYKDHQVTERTRLL